MANPGTFLGKALHAALRECVSSLKVTSKNVQMGILDLPAACVDSDGGRLLPAAAAQYLEEHRGSTLNSGSLPCPLRALLAYRGCIKINDHGRALL